VADFYSGRVTAFDWRTGEIRWRQTCSRESGRIAAFGQCGAVSSLGGRCCFLELTSGRMVAKRANVRSISDANDGTRMAIQRRRLEVITSCAAVTELELPVEGEWAHSWVGRSGLVVSQSNGLVKCFDLERRTERWRYDCGQPGAFVASVCLYEPHRVVFGVRTHVDHAFPPTAMMWDADTGETLYEEPSPDGIVTLHGVRHGRYMLAGPWRFDVERKRWEEWDFESLWP
jgi:outer membrane protein assembly factor BamB